MRLDCIVVAYRLGAVSFENTVCNRDADQIKLFFLRRLKQ